MTTQNKNKLMIGLLCIIIMGSTIWVTKNSKNTQNNVAVVRYDGNVIEEYCLDNEPDQIIDLKKQTGHEIKLEIKNHQIHFLESDCPDKICVKTGMLYYYGQSAICLPNKTSITIEEK